MIQGQNKMQTLLRRVGDQHRYQYILFIICATKWAIAGMVLFSLNFFYFVPDFECKNEQLAPDQSCADYVCSINDPQFWMQHLKKPIPNSITIDYEQIMLCGNAWMSSLLQSISYFGSFTGFIIMPHVADNIGRKMSERISWGLNIIGVIILLISFNLQMVGIGSFFMGFGTNAAITLHYSFIKQLVGGGTRSRMTIALQIAFSIGVSLISLLCWIFYSWKIVLGFFILLPSILLFVSVDFLIQQTPSFSLRKGKQQLLKSLNTIASINNCDALQMQEIDQILKQQQSQTSELEKSHKVSFIDLFRYKSLRTITIVCAMIDFIIEFIYDGTILSLDKLQVNVYLDQILVGLVQIGAALFAVYIVVKIQRKKFCTYNFMAISVCTALLGVFSLILSHQHDKQQKIDGFAIGQMIVLAFLRFFLSSTWGVFFVFIVQLFPASVTSLSFGWISTIGTAGATISPFIRLATAQFTMFFMAVLALSAVFLMSFLNQTKGLTIKANIKQVQQLQQNNNANKPPSVISQEK